MIYTTPSDVMEYLYCPRFIYYMKVLDIKQNEDKRALVQKGRKIHEIKSLINKDYLRKKIGAKDKIIDAYLTSEKLKLVGRIDEILILDNNKASPLDYKYSFWEGKIYKTFLIQQAFYSLLIEEKLDKKVEKAYIVYIRSKNHLKELSITKTIKKQAIDIIAEIFEILNLNYFPSKTKSTSRCLDCTYRNLCN